MDGSILMNSTISDGETTNNTVTNEIDGLDTFLLLLKSSIMVTIILAAVFGNLLVIVSVMRVRKLRLVNLNVHTSKVSPNSHAIIQ